MLDQSIRSIRDVVVRNKRVLLRADLNCPIDANGMILDDTRIRAVVPTIQYILDHGGSVILLSHLGRPKGVVRPELSLRVMAQHLASLIDRPVEFCPEAVGAQAQQAAQELLPGHVLVMENLRFYPGEEKPEQHPEFYKQLAALGDMYVQDAFATAHRRHASTYYLPQCFGDDRAAGLLLEREVYFLSKALAHPPQPFIVILGGAKVSSKIGLIKSIITRARALCLGGSLGITFLLATGHKIGAVEESEEHLALCRELLEESKRQGCKIVLPLDLVYQLPGDSKPLRLAVEQPAPADAIPLDVGPATVDAFIATFRSAALVLWNGPLGKFEQEPFHRGTLALAHAITECRGMTIAGGGETVAAIDMAQVGSRLTHLSTGGGATLELLEFGTLPGIDALRLT